MKGAKGMKGKEGQTVFRVVAVLPDGERRKMYTSHREQIADWLMETDANDFHVDKVNLYEMRQGRNY